MYFDVKDLYEKIENGLFIYKIDEKTVTKEQFEKYLLDFWASRGLLPDHSKSSRNLELVCLSSELFYNLQKIEKNPIAFAIRTGIIEPKTIQKKYESEEEENEENS